MTINNWLSHSKRTLRNAGIDSGALDSLILLEHITGENRAHLLAHTDQELTHAQSARLEILLTRRKKREPLAYILNTVEFYGRKFYVDKSVLVPRPESESFIEIIPDILSGKMTLLDMGCGSGVIGISSKLEYPSLAVTLSDISPSALKVAAHNAAVLDASVYFLEQDLFGLQPQVKYDIVLANLPYVPSELGVESELTFEPSLALFSGRDGLDLYRKFWKSITDNGPTYVATESLEGQHETLAQYAEKAGYTLLKTQLLIQVFIKV